ncbi:MAG: ABC transporter ATP-binding protein [Mycobacteriales bacterium]
MANSVAVDIAGLRVVRGRREVLHGLDCRIPAGTVTGLVGPSGCGKTTLLRSIVGVQIVHGGQVTVLGMPAGSAELRRRVGYSTQSPAVYGDLTVLENLRYFAAVRGIPVDEARRALDAIGLADQAHQVVGSLSGGQLSRASLAVALMGASELLILDEPTVGLDPVLRDELWALFHRLADGGRTLMISTHVMDEAARCEQIVLMRDGALLAHASPAELRRQTGADDLEKAFLHLVREREVASR